MAVAANPIEKKGFPKPFIYSFVAIVKSSSSNDVVEEKNPSALLRNSHILIPRRAKFFES